MRTTTTLTRGLAVAALTALMAFTAMGTGPAQTAASAAPAAAVKQAPRQTPQCDTGDLRASYHYRGGAAGTTYGVIRLTNLSGHTCRTGGYGGVSYVGHGDGTQIGAAAVRERPGAVRTIVLRPGERVASVIGETNAQNYGRQACRPTHVDGFRVYVPNETRSQYVPHATTGCASGAVKLLHQRPYHRA